MNRMTGPGDARKMWSSFGASASSPIPRILTIGHSNHPWERFLALLKGAEVAAVADVRSTPASRFAPQFNRRSLERALAAEAIGYLYLGDALGGRPKDAGLLRNGKPDYAAMARTAPFSGALSRLIETAQSKRVALMCAERDPTDCHRFLLIARALAADGESVAHILADGTIESHDATERRAQASRAPDLFEA